MAANLKGETTGTPHNELRARSGLNSTPCSVEQEEAGVRAFRKKLINYPQSRCIMYAYSSILMLSSQC